LPSLRDKTYLVMKQPRGKGVVELIEQIEQKDGALMPAARHAVAIGNRGDEQVSIAAFGKTVLIAGRSGIGKSSMITAITEGMAAGNFQFCIFDPEGDYKELQNSVCVGDVKTPPPLDEIFALLDRTSNNVVINTLAIELAQRPVFFTQVLPKIVSARARLGRPHWLIVDEAHHILPAGRKDLVSALPYDFGAAILVTVHPDSIATEALKNIGTVIAVGPNAPETISTFCKKTGRKAPSGIKPPVDDEVLFWRVGEGQPIAVKVRAPRQQHKRHTRKYAEGALSDEESFYFRGADGRLNLKAQNTSLFVQLAEGVDDETWQYHLRKGEYSRWFRSCIKDADLAEEAAAVERDQSLTPQESRQRIIDAINQRYTAPARAPDEN
jgi:Helicase HerA, central domain